MEDDEVYEARLRERRREMERSEERASASFAERMDDLRKAKPEPLLSRYGAKTIGDMALLDVGCLAWEKQDDAADYERRGGLIVEVTDTPEFTPDGEVIHHRAFRCYYWYWRPDSPQAWCTLTEEQVDLEACEGPQLRHVRSAYRKMCKSVGERRGNAHHYELDLVSVAARLAALVGQRWT